MALKNYFENRPNVTLKATSIELLTNQTISRCLETLNIGLATLDDGDTIYCDWNAVQPSSPMFEGVEKSPWRFVEFHKDGKTTYHWTLPEFSAKDFIEGSSLDRLRELILEADKRNR